MPPPPAEPLAARIFLGPALRAQSDKRLVTLVREGYEAAFEEIVRRYRRPLDRFAASIVGGRSEDVTQDAFSKALLALRGSEKEIELRPWLYRIVRNTALNDLRDRPPSAEELAETIPGGLSAAEEAERREEVAELMGRLRALPEPQRAAIVMRELEGLSHEEIAAALGLSGGAARQAIYRARAALRNGFAVLVPLPLIRTLFDHGTEAAAGGGLAAAGAASASGGAAGAALGGLGAGGALKIGVATALIAGSVGAGVAIQHERGNGSPESAAAAGLPGGATGRASTSTQDSPGASSAGSPLGGGGGRGHRGSGSGDDGRGGDRHGSGGDLPGSDGGSSGPGKGVGGQGPDSGGSSGHHGDPGDDHSGEGGSGGGHSGGGHSGGDDGSDDGGEGEHAHSGSSASGAGGDDHDGDSSGSSEPSPTVTPPPEESAPEDHSGEDGSGDSSESGGSGGEGGS
ncbi:MAG: RNA polymerase sigma factor [Solirubrobacterales bacterium]